LSSVCITNPSEEVIEASIFHHDDNQMVDAAIYRWWQDFVLDWTLLVCQYIRQSAELAKHGCARSSRDALKKLPSVRH
jgi:hypothetical protein